MRTTTRSSPDARRDRAITDAYEPGSTFKLITAAAALESGKVNTKSRFPARDRDAKSAAHVIHNAEDGLWPLAASTETLEDIIAYSHNVGAAEVGTAHRRSGRCTARSASSASATRRGVDLPGESPGIVPAAR